MKRHMAKMKENMTLKFQITKDADIEEAAFKVGDDVKIVREFGSHYLVRARDGHYYNIKKGAIDK